MIPEYIHLNESCIIDPMLLPFMNNNNNKDNINQTLPIPSTSTTDKTTQRNSIISHYSTTTSGSTFRDSFASSDGTNEYEELQARQQWSAEQSSLGHVRSERLPSTTSSSLQPSSRYLLSGATSSETFRQQELQRFYPPAPPSLSSSPPSSSPIPKDYSSSRKVKALSDPFTTMPSIALVTQPMEMKTSSYHPHYNPSNSTATTIPTYFNDPWTMTVNLALNDAICQDWLYKYETPTFAFSRSWKRRYVVLLDKTVYIFKSSHHSQHHYKKFYTTSSSSFSTTTPPIPSDRFLLTEDTLVFVSQEFKKGCVIELRKPLCKWYLRCESIDQMKCWLKILKKVVACIKLNYPSPLTTKLISNLSLTDDARLLIPKSSSSSPSASSTPHSFQQQLLQQQQQQQQQQLQEQQHQRSHSQRLSPLSKRLLSYSKKRNSTPPTLLQQQQQPFIALPPISFLDNNNNNNNNTPKRQSLTQIPHWEKTLPPALPPPTSLPPPPPTTASSPSPRIMTRSFSAGSTSFKKRSNESLSPIQLPTVVETLGDSIDPSFK